MQLGLEVQRVLQRAAIHVLSTDQELIHSASLARRDPFKQIRDRSIRQACPSWATDRRL